MKKNKALKAVKIIVIVLAAVLVILAGAAALIFNFVIKPNSEEIIKAVDEFMQDEEILKMAEPYMQPDLIPQNESGNESDTNVTGQGGENNSNSPEASAETEKNGGNENKPKKKRSEYNSQYDYVRDNVSESDFSRGMALASKVDIGYIMGLLSGGLTVAERNELTGYLKSHLSGSEISEGMALYYKYSYLLR